jgi:hypothetical protein
MTFDKDGCPSKADNPANNEETVFRRWVLKIICASGETTYSGKKVPLNDDEKKVMAALARHEGRILERDLAAELGHTSGQVFQTYKSILGKLKRTSPGAQEVLRRTSGGLYAFVDLGRQEPEIRESEKPSAISRTPSVAKSPEKPSTKLSSGPSRTKATPSKGRDPFAHFHQSTLIRRDDPRWQEKSSGSDPQPS